MGYPPVRALIQRKPSRTRGFFASSSDTNQILDIKCEIYKNSCIWVHRIDVRQQPFSSRQKAEIHKQILNKTWRRWQTMAPHPIPLPCALASVPQPSRRHHTQSLLGPSFHDPRTHHVLESHPEQASSLFRRDDERRHAICSHSTLALRLHLAACSPSSSYRFWVLDHLCSNLSQLFHLCWITEIWSLHLCVFTFSSSACAFLMEMNFSFKCLFAIWSLSPQRFHYNFYLSIVVWQYKKYSTILILETQLCGMVMALVVEDVD